jgi:hypothetical protein
LGQRYTALHGSGCSSEIRLQCRQSVQNSGTRLRSTASWLRSTASRPRLRGVGDAHRGCV